jgi:hypothetical protein
MILSDAELFELTGYKIPSKQAKWIEDHYGFRPPRKRFTGAVSVLWEQLHSKKEQTVISPEPKWKVA